MEKKTDSTLSLQKKTKTPDVVCSSQDALQDYRQVFSSIHN